jgi:hypothetical protein
MSFPRSGGFDAQDTLNRGVAWLGWFRQCHSEVGTATAQEMRSGGARPPANGGVDQTSDSHLP